MEDIKELKDGLKMYALITTIAILLSLLTGIAMLYMVGSTVVAEKMLLLSFAFGLISAFAIYVVVLWVQRSKVQAQPAPRKKKKKAKVGTKPSKSKVVEEYEEDEDEDEDEFDYDEDEDEDE